MNVMRSYLFPAVVLVIFMVFSTAYAEATGDSCSSTLTEASGSYNLHIPIITYGYSRLNADFVYVPTADNNVWFKLTGATALTDSSSFNICIPASLTSDLNLHSPELVFGSISLSADLQYVAGGDTGSGTDIMFKLTDAKLITYITGDSYSLASGSTVSVDGTLIIDVTNSVDIAGSLNAGSTNGQTIIIRAGGNVNLSGTLTGGNGASGLRGGDIGLISKNGNITITSSAAITSGDGAEGTYANNGRIEGGAGGIGGTVYIVAPNGTAAIPDKEGLFHIGNGGAGAAISISGNDLLTAAIPSQMPNGGGNSGGFDIRAKNITGLAYTTQTTTTDIKDPVTGAVLIPANTTLMLLTSDTQFTGGEGADAGSLNYGMDASGNSTWPAMSPRTAAGNENRHYVRKTSINDPFITGKKGGDGFRQGGNGQDVSRTAPEGYPVNVAGGDGGSCGSGLSFIIPGCTPGKGGNATAIGGNGYNAANAGEEGGPGGDATAQGGRGGIKYGYSSTLYFGAGGDATAYGGKGGGGGGKCPSNVLSKGGNGGKGGDAFAWGGNAGKAADTVESIGIGKAYGGNGGKSGDGSSTAGGGGTGGTAESNGDTGSSATNGSNGGGGTVCTPQTAKTCTYNGTDVTYTVVNSATQWSLATTQSQFLRFCGGGGANTPCDAGTIFTDGQAYTFAGCTVTIHCP